MNINLYTTQSEKNRINKTLTLVASKTGTLKDDCNVENPVIEISMTNAQSSILGCNYAYIPAFNRYYFIEDKAVINNDFVTIQLKVDVLMSYANEIMNTEMLIERSETYKSQYVTDNMKMAENFPMVLTKAFSGGFNPPHFYLTVASSVESS